jgi:CubicO group peptidase (beta-lactamase class C family)
MSLPGRQCFAVFRNGYLVYEKYYTGDAHTKNAGYSTSKSFGSSLVGMAVTQGLFKTDDLVKALVPDTTVGADVQIKHLLTMTGHIELPGRRSTTPWDRCCWATRDAITISRA